MSGLSPEVLATVDAVACPRCHVVRGRTCRTKERRPMLRKSHPERLRAREAQEAHAAHQAMVDALSPAERADYERRFPGSTK